MCTVFNSVSYVGERLRKAVHKPIEQHQDLSLCYETNFGMSGEAKSALAGTSKGVETVIVSIVYKKMVARLIDRFSWIRSPENMTLYNDVRSLMNYVKAAHGGVFRRVVLCALLDSTQKTVKTQCRVEQM